MIEEIEPIKEKEQNFIDERIKEKRHGTPENIKNQAEYERDIEVAKKEILVMYSQLNPKFFNLDLLEKCTKSFPQQSQS